jgi:hypothetical protein
MRRKTIIGLVTAGVIFGLVGSVYAAPKIINITRRLGGVAGSIFKIDGTLQVRSLAVSDSFNAKYDNRDSGLTAKTYKGAIDQLGMSLSKLLKGSGLKVSSKSTKTTASSTTAANTSSTWSGYAYISTTNPFGDNPVVTKTQKITVTFTPQTDTTGTFTSTPLYVFAVGGDHLAFNLGGGSYTVCGRSALTGYGIGANLPTGTYGGKYEVVGDFKIWTFPTSAVNSPCAAPAEGWFGSYSHPSDISTKGNTMTLTNDDGTQIILTRQSS